MNPMGTSVSERYIDMIKRSLQRSNDSKYKNYEDWYDNGPGSEKFIREVRKAMKTCQEDKNSNSESEYVMIETNVKVKEDILEETIKKIASKMVDDLLYDLTDRRGFRQEWDNCDKGIQEEIRDTWISIVSKHIMP